MFMRASLRTNAARKYDLRRSLKSNLDGPRCFHCIGDPPSGVGPLCAGSRLKLQDFHDLARLGLRRLGVEHAKVDAPT